MLKQCGKGCWLFIACLFCSYPAYAAIGVSVDLTEVIVCPSSNDNGPVPTFTESECVTKPLREVNPQNTALWLKTTIILSEQNILLMRPAGLYVFAKMSSLVYFNGTLLGRNGTPSAIPRDEFAGDMDARFYIPPEQIHAGINNIVLRVSSHRGFLTLGGPIHFIGISEYADTTQFFQSHLLISMSLFGALLLGTIYLAALARRSEQNASTGLFSLLALFASAQLFAEISRGLFNYSYPLHDLRLIIIVTLAGAFGFCLLLHSVRKFSDRFKTHWLLAGSATTLLMMILSPGFDAKTALAILVPALFGCCLSLFHYFSNKSKASLGYLLAYIIFNVTIFLTLRDFHSIYFFYIITGMIVYLFIKQAGELVDERAKRIAEELQVSRLQLALDQNEQQQTPARLSINSAGKTELIATDTITYCKASGDYVEINLEPEGQTLYSGSMKSLEAQLPGTFLKVHRSYMVNVDFVARILSDKSSDSGRGFLQLKNGDEIPVSRRILPMVRGAIRQVT